MKVKLLKKARRKCKVYKRGSVYYVLHNGLLNEYKFENNALCYYRIWVIRYAKEIFGFKPKERIR